MEELLISINSQLNKYAETVVQCDQQDASSFGKYIDEKSVRAKSCANAFFNKGV
ncbi:hypothetical protein IGJ34_000233 [Enterococcus sp. AZ177]